MKLKNYKQTIVTSINSSYKWLFMITCTSFHLLFSGCNGNNETYKIIYKEFNECVYASGEIFPREYSFIKATSNNLIIDILVKENDIVKKGEDIAILGTIEDLENSKIIKNQISNIQYSLLDESSILNELIVNINLSKNKYETLLKNITSYRELAETKAISQKELDSKEFELKKAFSEYENSINQYDSKKVELQNNLYSIQRQNYQNTQILKSPISGKIFSIDKKNGDLLQLEESLAFIGSENDFKLELLVDERDISKLEIGQKVYFETDIYPNKQFNASIIQINNLLQKRSRSFKVIATILDDTKFYPQSSVEANILINSNKKALFIPMDYLIKGDSIYVSENNSFKSIKVTTGIQINDEIEIISGVNEGTLIIKPH